MEVETNTIIIVELITMDGHIWAKRYNKSIYIPKVFKAICAYEYFTTALDIDNKIWATIIICPGRRFWPGPDIFTKIPNIKADVLSRGKSITRSKIKGGHTLL